MFLNEWKLRNVHFLWYCYKSWFPQDQCLFLALLHLNVPRKQKLLAFALALTLLFFWLVSSQDPLWLSRVLALFHSCKCLLRLHSVMWGQRLCHWRSPLMSGMSSAFLIPPLTLGQRHVDYLWPGITALVGHVYFMLGSLFFPQMYSLLTFSTAQWVSTYLLESIQQVFSVCLKLCVTRLIAKETSL